MKAIFSAALISSAFIFPLCGEPAPRPTRPNIVFIFTDQQTAQAMSSAGNPWVQTPAMDSLVQNGVRFTQAYCTLPVCTPSRASFITGRMPHENGATYNNSPVVEGMSNLGDSLKAVGYDTVWAGKWHLPESYPTMKDPSLKSVPGFDLLPFYDPKAPNWELGSYTDSALTDAAVKYLEERDSDNPFFLTISFHNPHDICKFVTRPDAFDPLPHPDAAPLLPDNFDIDPSEPEYQQDARTRRTYGNEVSKAQKFSNEQWRAYSYTYYRMVEKVDREVGRVLDALEKAGLEENTLVVFSSDHGDGVAAHHWAAKLSFYEESVAIPFVVSWPGHIQAGVVNNTHLVSGLDLVPTLCDYAEATAPPKQRGLSLRPLLQNTLTKPWREFVVTELALDPKEPQKCGRMVRTKDYKYCVYSYGERNEQLFDRQKDAGEKNNLALNPTAEIQEILNQHRALLKGWMLETQDPFVDYLKGE